MNNAKFVKCPRCGKKNLGENLYCEHCLAPLVKNKLQDLFATWEK